MKTRIALLGVLTLILALMGVTASLAQESGLPVELAAEGQSEEGFVCLLAEDGTVYAQTGVEKFAQLFRANAIADDGSVLKVEVIPDNEEMYPYLYPEKAWKAVVFTDALPDWYAAASGNVEAAFENWKNEVYGYFDVVALRETTADSTLSVSPDESYEATEEDIAAFIEYIRVSNALCTYIKTSVNDTIENAIGASVTGDLWNYLNRDVAETAKHAGDVGSLLREMGVSNVGVVQNDFSGAYTGSFFADTISTWNYYDGDIEDYPYRSAVYLWNHGLAISEDSSNIWRLHCAGDGRILYELSNDEVSTSNAFACVVAEDGTVYWQMGLDNTDAIRAAFGIESVSAANVQVKPVLDESKATLSLPDGNNPDVTRYFPYLDDAAEWTVIVLNPEDAGWFDDAAEQSVLTAFEAWQEAVFGGFHFEEAKAVFTEETKNVAAYEQEDIALLKDWAIAWHGLKDQGMDPTAALIMSGHQGIGSSVWDDFDAFLLAAWRVRHEACPGDVAQAGFFALQGITDSQQYDHEIGDVIGDSVSDVMEALAGYFFDNITEWAYTQSDAQAYPFAAGAQLVMKNLVPYTDGTNWYLCSGAACDIVFTISEAELLGE